VRDGNFEQLIILAVVVMAWVVNFVLDLVRRRGRPAPPQDRAENLAVEGDEIDLAEVIRRERAAEVARPGPEPRSAEPRPPVVVVPAVTPVRAPVAPPRPAARVPKRGRLQRRINPSEARRGVVLMTILGPCRGVEPPPNGSSAGGQR
jgi:hypothetical protein